MKEDDKSKPHRHLRAVPDFHVDSPNRTENGVPHLRLVVDNFVELSVVQDNVKEEGTKQGEQPEDV